MFGAAIVVRGGPAIGVDRYHGQPLAVTTTHAADSPAHVYQLVARAGAREADPLAKRAAFSAASLKTIDGLCPYADPLSGTT